MEYGIRYCPKRYVIRDCDATQRVLTKTHKSDQGVPFGTHNMHPQAKLPSEGLDPLYCHTIDSLDQKVC